MERLTIHNGMYKRLDPEQAEAIYKKLRAYEDTGLEPEQCAKYAQAEKEGRYIVLKEPRSAGVHRLEEIARADIEGRLVVLPCKVGDTVYTFYNGKNCKWPCNMKKNKVYDVKVSGLRLHDWSDDWSALLFFDTKEMSGDYEFSFDEFGKTVFLTREEAEKAMEGEKT